MWPMPDSHVHLERLEVMRTLVRFVEEWDELYPALARATSLDDRRTIIAERLGVSVELATTALDLQVRRLFEVERFRAELQELEGEGAP